MKFMFDCDDTLYDLQWPFRMAIQESFPEAIGYDYDIFYKTYRDIGDTIFHKIQSGEITSDEGGIYRIYHASRAFGIDLSMERSIQFQNTYKKYQYKISMDPAFKEYLMKQDLEYAILTNGEDTHQRMKCSVLKVEDFVDDDHIFTSGDIGYAKPNIELYREVFKRLKDLPENWCYIGDNYTNDMEGAKKAGMHTIHFNRHHTKEGMASDYVVYNEKELIEVMEHLKNQ
ncbi:MAG: HAD family hydrolase [Holdemanella sp.]|nr:HAD family hydrolase [Holdemanella sp.]